MAATRSMGNQEYKLLSGQSIDNQENAVSEADFRRAQPTEGNEVVLKEWGGNVVTSVMKGATLTIIEWQDNRVKVKVTNEALEGWTEAENVGTRLDYLVSQLDVYRHLSELTAEAQIGDTILKVADNSYFEMGQQIFIRANADENPEPLTVLHIGSSVTAIRLQSPLSRHHQVGAKVQAHKYCLGRVSQCAEHLTKDLYHLQDFITDVSVCVALHYAEADVIHDISIVQSCHLASCVAGNILIYCYIRFGRKNHELYGIIMQERSVFKLWNALLSFTGVEHHAMFIQWHGTLRSDESELPPIYRGLIREIDGLSAISKAYESFFQTGFQVAVVVVQKELGFKVMNIQMVSLASSVVSFTLICLGDLATHYVRDPQNPGYIPDMETNLADKRRVAFGNVWSVGIGYTIFDLLLCASAGLTVWVWRRFESIYTQSLWVMIVVLGFLCHLAGHAHFLQCNRSRMKHLLGHNILIFNRGAFVMLLSFFSPLAARFYNPKPGVETNQNWCAILGTTLLYLVVGAGYGYAIWLRPFAVDTIHLVAGAFGTFVALVTSIWFGCEGVDIAEEAGDDIKQWIGLIADGGPPVDDVEAVNNELCVVRRLRSCHCWDRIITKVDTSWRQVRQTKIGHAMAAVFLASCLLVLACSMILQFTWLAPAEEHQAFTISGFDKRIDGEYHAAGSHNRRPYFKQRGDHHETQPIIYFTPKNGADDNDKWIIGHAVKPFQPVFQFGSATIPILIDALSKSPAPSCQKVQDFKACLAFTTEIAPFSPAKIKNPNGTCSSKWKKFNKMSEVYDPKELCISSPGFFSSESRLRIIVGGRTADDIPEDAKRFFGEFQVDEIKESFAGLSAVGGPRFWEGHPVFKQSSQFGNDNVTELLEPLYMFLLDGTWAMDKRRPWLQVDLKAFKPAYEILPSISPFLQEGSIRKPYWNFSYDHPSKARCKIRVTPSRGDAIACAVSVGKCSNVCLGGCSGWNLMQCLRCHPGSYRKQNQECAVKKCRCEHGAPTRGLLCGANNATGCKSCDDGYNLSRSSCKAFTCATGTGGHCKQCRPQFARTANNQCLGCNSGYRRDGTDCKAQAFTCATGTGAHCKECKSQAARTANNQCTGCNSGYRLDGTDCKAQSARTNLTTRSTNRSRSALPPGWHTYTDPASHATYYGNPRTGQSSLTPPRRNPHPGTNSSQKNQGCGWTKDWSCPGQSKGRKGKAEDDGSFAYKICCGEHSGRKKASQACTDTPGWINGPGRISCHGYETRAWCKGGKVIFGGGARFKNPELNCCVCGKAKVSPPTPAPRLLKKASPSVRQQACTDTPGWINGPRKYGCHEYETNLWCRGGKVMFGGGARFKNPELNCCVCGKPQPRPSKKASPSVRQQACTDTPGWTNSNITAHGCQDYETKKWCAGGKVTYAGGARLKNPELHCCVCGKEA